MKEQIAISRLYDRSLFAEAVAAARRDDRPRVVSVSVPALEVDPIDLFAVAQSRTDGAMLWQLPSERVALVGVGVEAEFVGNGSERFADVGRRWRQLLAEAFVVDESGSAAKHPGPGPIAMGGFAFAPGGAAGPWTGFGDGRLTLPRAVYGAVGTGVWLTINTIVTATTDPDEVVDTLQREQHVWKEDFRRARGAVRADFPNSVTGATAVVPTNRASASGVHSATRPEMAAVAASEDIPSKERWLSAIERVANNIQAGRLEKAVLARSVRVPVPDGFSVAAALRRLRADYPETYVFAVAGDHGCFLGATPERIVHLAENVVNVACLAGSMGRGDTEAEDRALGDMLLADSKNVEEHQVVLRSILAALEPVCDAVTAGAKPGLRKFANVQHLYTPVRARARSGVNVLDLVSRVHPTPAIGGHPTSDALELIAREEEMDRGWYAGPIGWMDSEGDGEFAVGLRSGLLRDGNAHLFAGCGIMGDSDPESEFTESVLKLRPMRRALEAGKQ